jgi:SAM-dependent methyltransferase
LAVIAPTIIPVVHDSTDLVGFYDRAYSQPPAEAALYSRWRALSAVGKADHVATLCARAGLLPRSVLDVGCGDGALLSALRARGLAARLAGVEITQQAVVLARARDGVGPVELYDGERLPFAPHAFDLGVLSHVLEHVPDPAALLGEVARVCGAVIVEVPLEANWSARRAGKRAHAAEVGHLQRLDRAGARTLVARAGLVVAAELEDPLPLDVHTFFARTTRARTAGAAKWSLRAATLRVAAPLARRAFTLHYACLCLPPDA